MNPQKQSRSQREKATGSQTISKPRFPKTDQQISRWVQELAVEARAAAAEAAQTVEEVDLYVEDALEARQAAQEVLRSLRRTELPASVLEAIRKAAEEAAQKAARQPAQQAAKAAAWQAAQQAVQPFVQPSGDPSPAGA